MQTLHINIVLQDYLSERWRVWFEGLEIAKTNADSTCISGELADYSALYGLLERIRDLNLHLISVQVQPISPKGNEK